MFCQYQKIILAPVQVPCNKSCVPLSPTPADDTNRPVPPPDRPVVRKPNPIGFLIDLVHKLSEYGRNLANTLQQPASANANDLSGLSRRFGTKDIALIMARITRGLLIATMLETRLIARVNRKERAQPAGRTGTSSAPTAPPRKPRAAQPPRPAAQWAWEPDPRLAAMPSEEEIAAEIRRRPVGAVLADICRDLGILPADPLWRELQEAIIFNGGNFVRLFKDIWKRGMAWLDELSPEMREMSLVPPYPGAAPGTGPP